MSDISEWERKGCPLYEKTPWPKNSTELDLDWVLKTFEQHHKRMHNLAMKLIRCFAVGLGKREDYFDPWFKDESTAVFRGLHYLPRPADVILDNKNDQKLVAPEHSDSGFITLLTTFMYPGLQVLFEGEYRSIKSVKNAIVINIGATLEKISNNKIVATRHRVLDIGCERYSTPFFFEPKFSARISNNTLSSKRQQCEDHCREEDPI